MMIKSKFQNAVRRTGQAMAVVAAGVILSLGLPFPAGAQNGAGGMGDRR
jgi:hypothetical protein